MKVVIQEHKVKENAPIEYRVRFRPSGTLDAFKLGVLHERIRSGCAVIRDDESGQIVSLSVDILLLLEDITKGVRL